MKNKKGLFAVAGILSVIGAVGAAIGIKKIKETVAKEEILIKECDLKDDVCVEVLDDEQVGCMPQDCAGCDCACGVQMDEEPTENIAEIEDLEEFGVATDILEEINKEIAAKEVE